MSPQSIILAGAGHVHAALLPQVRRWVAAGHPVTLLAPEAFSYSGMGTGVLAGQYSPAANRLDVHAAFARAGAVAHRCRVERVDPGRNIVFTDDGCEHPYDWLSLNLGSRVPVEAIADPNGRLVPAKPVNRLADLARALRALQVPVLPAKAEQVTAETVLLANGQAVPAGMAVVAALGVRPVVPAGLPEAPQGGVPVTETLQVASHPAVFAVGDGAAWDPPLDRVGVHAVRQTPVLAANLSASLDGRPLRPFRPQRHYLQILNLSDGTGLLAWRGVVIRSRWALWLKDRLDRGFMERLKSR
ncbi:MAG: NAD(P)/FAD-dependent oxidoreductase [Opitutales bacterium]